MPFEWTAPWFQNFYRCDPCDLIWDDEWSCACNDRCPGCDAEMTPYSSIDLCLTLSKEELEKASDLLPRPLWPPRVIEIIQERMEG